MNQISISLKSANWRLSWPARSYLRSWSSLYQRFSTEKRELRQYVCHKSQTQPFCTGRKIKLTDRLSQPIRDPGDKHLETTWWDKISKAEQYAEPRQKNWTCFPNLGCVGRLFRSGSTVARPCTKFNSRIYPLQLWYSPYYTQSTQIPEWETRTIFCIDLMVPAQWDWPSTILGWPKEWWLTTVLYWLPKAECHDCERPLLDVTNSQLSWPFRRTPTYFQKLRSHSGFHRMDPDHLDKDRTAFILKHRLCKFPKMPLSLKNFQADSSEWWPPYRTLDVATSALFPACYLQLFRSCTSNRTRIKQLWTNFRDSSCQ